MNFNKIFSSGLLWLAFITLPAVSCVKTATPPGTASLTVENCIAGCSTITTNFEGGKSLTYNWTANMIAFGYFQFSDQMSVLPGTQHLALFQYGDTTDHSVPLINVSLDVEAGKYYSLFCVGTIDHPDTLFLKERVPDYGADSVAGIRFANFSAGSAPISINLTGQPYGSVVASLPYKSMTDFIRFPATSDVFNDLFEFRDAATGNLIAVRNARQVGQPGMDYSPNTWQFKSNTLALVGIPGGTDYTTMQAIDVIRNY